MNLQAILNRTVSNTRTGRRGFTIIEIIVVVVIIGVLAAVIAPRLIGRVGQAKRTTAEANAAALSTAVELYMNECGPVPEGAVLADFLLRCPSGVDAETWNRSGPYIKNSDQLNDPWGRLFVIIVPGTKNKDFDIVSYGADGKLGGDGDNKDIIKP